MIDDDILADVDEDAHDYDNDNVDELQITQRLSLSITSQ